jgi:hypothetical protein
MGMELQRRKMMELGMGIFGKHREWNIKGVKSWRVGTSNGSKHRESEHQRDRTHKNTSSSQIKSKFFSYTHFLFSLK